MARFEWIIIELLVLGILGWQLVSVRREIRRHRLQKKEVERP
jgi:hypothetical protein